MQFLTSNGKLGFFCLWPPVFWARNMLPNKMKESKSLVHAIKSAQCLHTQNWPSSSMEEMSKCKSCLLERYAYPQSHFTSILWNIEIAKRWTKTISQFSIMHGRGMLWLHSSICFLAPQDSPLANGSMCFRSIFDMTLAK